MRGGEAMLAGGLEPPLQFAGGGVHRVEVVVIAADVNHAIGYCRGRGDVAARLEFPLERAGREVDGIEIVVVAANVGHAVSQGWRGDDGAVGLELPFDPAEVRDASAAINAGVLGIAAEHGGILTCGRET